MENEKKTWKQHNDEFLLKLSSTKHGQVEAEPNGEDAPPANLKTIGLLFGAMALIILVAAGAYFLFTSAPTWLAVLILAVVVILATLVMMVVRKNWSAPEDKEEKE